MRVHLAFSAGKNKPDSHVGFIVMEWRHWWEFLNALENRTNAGDDQKEFNRD